MKKIFLILFLLFLSFELSFASTWTLSKKADVKKAQTTSSKNTAKSASNSSPSSLWNDLPKSWGNDNLQKIDKNSSSFNNDLFSWIASYNYDFEFPAWIRWLTPNLWISYNSAKVDYLNDSWYWFNINTESIFRSTKKWNDKLYSLDEFAINSSFSNNEIQNVWTWKFVWVLNNDLNKYVFKNDSWRVNDNNWNTYFFWNTDDSKQINPDNSKTFRWLLSKKQDNFWNEIKYFYTKVDNNAYLSEIQYAINGNNPLYKLNLEYLQKNFSAISYIHWFKLENHKLLKNVIVSFNNAWKYEELKRYELNYDDVETIFPKLRKITEKSAEQVNDNVSFEYFNSWIWINLLSKIDNWRWLTTSLEYKSSPLYQNTTVPFIIKTLNKVVYNDSITGLNYSKTYDYYGWNFYFDPTNIYNRWYTWFSKVKIIDDDLSYKFVYFHQSDSDKNNPNDSLNWEFEDHISKKWRIYREEEYDENNSLYTTKITKWVKQDKWNNIYFVAPERITNILWNKSLAHIDTAETFEYDKYLNVTKDIKYGEVKANTNNWDFEDIKEDKKVTNYKYAIDSNFIIINKACSDETLNFSWLSISQNKYVYDNLWDCLVQKWLLTQKWLYYKESNKYISQNFSYENWLIKTKSDFLGNTTSYIYDTYGLLLASETNPKLWTSNYNSYDYKIQKPLEIVDYNNIKTKYKYDNFWNITQKSIIKPDDNSEIILEKNLYNFVTTPNYIENTKYLDANNSIISRVYFDWLWRQIESKVSSKYDNKYSTIKIKYDKDWNQEFVTYSIFENIINYTGIWDNEKGNKFTFDSIWRLITQTNKTWTTKFEYDLLKTTQINQKLVKKDLVNDVFWNLVKVIEYNEWQTYETNYVYNDLNKLSKITDSKQNVRNFVYDSLGRQTKAEDLHFANSSSFWSINYNIYNDNWLLLEKSVMSWDKINYLYDNLSRLTNEDTWNEHSSISYYETVPYRWQIEFTKNNSYVENYKYNYLWQKIEDQKFYSDWTYLLKYEYDLVWNIRKITYPDWKITEYFYEKWYLNSIRYDSSIVLVSIDYEANNKPRKYTYINWLVDESIFDYEYWYRLTSKKSYFDWKIYQDISYLFDEVWNITHINNIADNHWWKQSDYIYDDLSRLKTFNINLKSWKLKTYNYSYDSIWNIVKNSDFWADYVYDWINSNPHAITSIWERIDLSYDKNWNVSKEKRKKEKKVFEYNAKNELVSSTFSWSQTNYLYDSSGNRISKRTDYDWKIDENKYLDNIYEIQNLKDKKLDRKKKYIYVGDTKIITVNSNDSIVYNLQDHLWWANIDLNNNWVILQLADYLPYWWQRVLNRSRDFVNNYLFTWKEFDEETELQYFEARYYNPDYGRFYWQDRLFWELWQTKRWLQVLQDPQQLNSYSYARNNPVIYVDPSGESVAIDSWTPLTGLLSLYVNTVVVAGLTLWDWVNKLIDVYQNSQSSKSESKSDTKIKVPDSSVSWSSWWDWWNDKKKKDEENKKQNQIDSLKKWIRSLEEQISKHYENIEKLKEWIYKLDYSKIKWDTNKYLEWLPKHWQKEINEFKNQIINKEQMIKDLMNN